MDLTPIHPVVADPVVPLIVEMNPLGTLRKAGSGKEPVRALSRLFRFSVAQPAAGQASHEETRWVQRPFGSQYRQVRVLPEIGLQDRGVDRYAGRLFVGSVPFSQFRLGVQRLGLAHLTWRGGRIIVFQVEKVGQHRILGQHVL